MGDIDIKEMIDEIKAHPEADKIGMILTHLGIVRGTSRDGMHVDSINVSYDRDRVSEIIMDIKGREGIVEVLIKFNEGELKVGEPVMAICVAGDIRENVFPALMDAVNGIKKEACIKKERVKES